MLVGCPIRKCVDHLVCAHPHALSQLIASFVASESLGIPRVPFVTSVTTPLKEKLSSGQIHLTAYSTFFFLLTRYTTSKNIRLLIRNQCEEKTSPYSASIY